MLGIWKCCAHWNGRVPDPDLLCEVVQLALPHKMCLIGAMSIELAAYSGGGTRFDTAGVAGRLVAHMDSPSKPLQRGQMSDRQNSIPVQDHPNTILASPRLCTLLT